MSAKVRRPSRTMVRSTCNHCGGGPGNSSANFRCACTRARHERTKPVASLTTSCPTMVSSPKLHQRRWAPVASQGFPHMQELDRPTKTGWGNPERRCMAVENSSNDMCRWGMARFAGSNPPMPFPPEERIGDGSESGASMRMLERVKCMCTTRSAWRLTGPSGGPRVY